MQLSEQDKAKITAELMPILESMRKDGKTQKEIEVYTMRFIRARRNCNNNHKPNGLTPLSGIMPGVMEKLNGRPKRRP